MKKYMVWLISVLMAVSMTACTNTQKKDTKDQAQITTAAKETETTTEAAKTTSKKEKKNEKEKNKKKSQKKNTPVDTRKNWPVLTRQKYFVKYGNCPTEKTFCSFATKKKVISVTDIS